MALKLETVDPLVFVIGVNLGHSGPHLLVSISWFCCCSSSLISLPAVCHCDCWMSDMEYRKSTKEILTLNCLVFMMKYFFSVILCLSRRYTLSCRELVSYEFGIEITVLSDGTGREATQPCKIICQHDDAKTMQLHFNNIKR